MIYCILISEKEKALLLPAPIWISYYSCHFTQLSCFCLYLKLSKLLFAYVIFQLSHLNIFFCIFCITWSCLYFNTHHISKSFSKCNTSYHWFIPPSSHRTSWFMPFVHDTTFLPFPSSEDRAAGIGWFRRRDSEWWREVCSNRCAGVGAYARR